MSTRKKRHLDILPRGHMTFYWNDIWISTGMIYYTEIFTFQSD